jgi:hypothetical protein
LKSIIAILINLKALVDKFRLVVVFSITSIFYTLLASLILNSKVVVYLVNTKNNIVSKLYYKAFIN